MLSVFSYFNQFLDTGHNFYAHFYVEGCWRCLAAMILVIIIIPWERLRAPAVTVREVESTDTRKVQSADDWKFEAINRYGRWIEVESIDSIE